MKKTKRLFTLFLMVFALLAGSLSVFAEEDIETKFGVTKEQVNEFVEGYIGQLSNASAEELEMYKEQSPEIASWIEVSENGGAFVSILNEKVVYEIHDDEGFTATIPVKLENKTITATMEYSAATGGVSLSFTDGEGTGAMGLGEIFKKAGLNTLLGMGTVFVMLCFISILIWLLGFIPKLMSDKKAETKEVVTAKPAPVVEQIIAKEEANDTELVAVIAAAIAAATGTSTDAFVVRSIRKVKRS